MVYYRHKNKYGKKRTISGYTTKRGRTVPKYRRTMRKDIRKYRSVKSRKSNTPRMRRRIRKHI